MRNYVYSEDSRLRHQHREESSSGNHKPYEKQFVTDLEKSISSYSTMYKFIFWDGLLRYSDLHSMSSQV